MTIENTDFLLVNRGSDSYKIKYEKIKQDIDDSTDKVPEAPVDGKQYGREDGEWTEIVHTPEYTDADVDAHLNQSAASGGQILSWNGTDYQWVADQTGGSELSTYTHPGGISRSVQSRLQDYTSVKDFGAVGNNSDDDTQKIQAAIDWVGQNGGGTVYFPPGTYRVRIQNKNDSPSSSEWKLCALTIPYDNVHILGAGSGSTRIKALDLNPSLGDEYGIIQVAKPPINNGETDITGGSIRNITLDNHVNSTTQLNGGTLTLRGLEDYTVESVVIRNGGFYGIGMQNGGFKNIVFQNIYLKDINRDGIDLKDNGAVSFGIQLDNIVCENVGRGTATGAPYACIDLMGEGLQLSNILIRDIGSGAAAGLRIKQGGTRGNPGWYTNVSGVNIKTTNSIKHGIQVKARGVSIYGAKIIGPFEYGVLFEQAGGSLNGSYIEGNRSSTVGCYIEPNNDSAADGYPDPGGDFTMIQGCTFNTLDTCVLVRRPYCNISNNSFWNAEVGVDLNNDNVTSAVVFGNAFGTTSGVDEVKNDIAQPSNKELYVLNNVSDFGPRITVSKTSVGEIMALTAADGDKQIKISQNGVGFYGTNPVQRQEITGDTGSNLNAVVRDLLNELNQTGLIKNSTTNSGTPSPSPSPPSGPFDPNGMITTSPDRIGFYGEAPVQRQTVSGNLQTNLDDVVRDLIRELAQTGLIINSTTG